MLQMPKVNPQSERTHGKSLLARWRGRSADLSRCSKYKLVRNAGTSLIGETTRGDSNPFSADEVPYIAEERRLDGALFSDAPTEIRTPVLGLKGLRPSPLDDGGEYSEEFYHLGICRSNRL